MKKFLVLATLAVLTSPLWAAMQNITLSVPGMNCAVCPITVKAALSKVSGVSQVDVNLDRREAQVSFDDAVANVDLLTAATRDAGYPSTLVGPAQ